MKLLKLIKEYKMAKYLGEKLVNQNDVEEFKSFSQSDWAMYFIEQYGGFDGAHHKAWVIDQVARLLKGMPVIIKLATWDDGNQEYRVTVSKEESTEYKKWRIKMSDDCESEFLYEDDYNEGIPP